MQKQIKKTKSKIFKIISLILILSGMGAGIFFYSNQEKPIKYTTTPIKQGNILQTVSETGTIKSPTVLDLKFLTSGVLKTVLVKVGEKITNGQVLVQLDDVNLKIKEKEQLAGLVAAQTNLAKLQAGAQSVDIAVSQAMVNQAESAYQSAQAELVKTKDSVNENIKQAQTNLDDLLKDTENNTAYEQSVNLAQVNLDNTKTTYQNAIKNQKDLALVEIEAKITSANTALANLNRIITDEDLEKVLSIKNTTYLSLTKSQSVEAESLVNTAETNLTQAKNDSNIALTQKTLLSALDMLNRVFSALNSGYSALNNSIASADVSQASLDAYKNTINNQSNIISAGTLTLQSAKQNLADAILNYETKIAVAQEDLNRARSGLNDAIISARNTLSSAQVVGAQKIQTSEAQVKSSYQALKVAQTNLTKIKTPVSLYDIELARAQVSQAQSGLDLIRSQLTDAILKSPLDGVITKVNYKEGEQISVGQSIFSLIGENNLEIEVLIGETDIAKIKINDKAEITLDSLGEDIKFKALIEAIDPSATTVSDVIYYKTTLAFDKQTDFSRIKPGMTANIVIITESKNNILTVLNRAIVEKKDEKTNERKQYLQILKNNQVNDILVKTGLRGDGGYVEVESIKAGEIKAGDEAVLYIL